MRSRIDSMVFEAPGKSYVISRVSHSEGTIWSSDGNSITHHIHYQQEQVAQSIEWVNPGFSQQQLHRETPTDTSLD
jgi:hypothetical protein